MPTGSSGQPGSISGNPLMHQHYQHQHNNNKSANKDTTTTAAATTTKLPAAFLSFNN